MLIGCDLFTSTIDFQKLSIRNLKKFKKYKGIKIISLNPKLKNDPAYPNIDIYWGNRINIKILNKMRNLKWIHYGSTGINHEVVDYAKKKPNTDNKYKKNF